MNHSASEHWPPLKPSEDSFEVASSMFFRHLRDVAGPSAKSKKAQYLLQRTESGKHSIITALAYPKKEIVFISAFVRARMKFKIDGIFNSSLETDYDFDHEIVVKTLNTLPDDQDLQILADTLIHELCVEQEAAKEDPDNAEMYVETADGKETMSREQIISMNACMDRMIKNARLLHRQMLDRKVMVPKW